MNFSAADLIATVVLLIPLLVAARYRRSSIRHPESHRIIAAAVAVLAVSALLRTYHVLGLFARIDFLSNPIFFRLVFWLGVVTGTSLIAIALYRRYIDIGLNPQQRQSQRRLEFMRKTEQLASVETRLPVLLRTTLNHVAHFFPIRFGAVFLYTDRSRGPSLVSVTDSSTFSREKVSDISFADAPDHGRLCTAPAAGRALIENMPTEIPFPDSVLPVMLGRHVIAVFLFWQKPGRPISTQDWYDLRLALQAVTQQVPRQHPGRSEVLHRRQPDQVPALEPHLEPSQSFAGNVPKIAAWLQSVLPADFISFTVAYDGKSIHRFSIGRDGKGLTEKQADAFTHREFFDCVLKSEQPIVINDLSAKTTLPLDNLLRRSGMNSLLAAAVTSRESAGAVVVAARSFARFTPEDVEMARRMLPHLKGVIIDEFRRYEAAAKQRFLDRLREFLVACNDPLDLSDLFNQAAALLMREARTSMVRISTYESGGSLLQSRALALLRPIEGVTPANGKMILSLMPRHQTVRDTRQSVLINSDQIEHKMTLTERRQLCSARTSSALLVPITIDNKAVGVISLAEMRRRTRFQYSPADAGLAGAVAGALSLAIQLLLARDRARSVSLGRDATDSISTPHPELRGKIRSSLSSILGSVEMIRFREPHPGDNVARFLNIIDRSAQRLCGLFQEETPTG